MSDHDPAFQWETEALRTTRPASGSASESPQTHSAPPNEKTTMERPEPPSPQSTADWLTLREAHEATGIPVETLRKWGRRGTITSVLEETDYGTRRLVDPASVTERAAHLGRPIAPVTEPPAAPGAREAASTPEADEAPQVELPPPGTMIVPIDAWEKMLIQLGNLHEAGQQLAEARERAARAETEAEFLRDRLAELRGAASTPQEAVPPEPPPPAASPATSAGAESTTPGLRKYAAARWKAWRRR